MRGRQNFGQEQTTKKTEEKNDQRCKTFWGCNLPASNQFATSTKLWLERRRFQV
jgi:hypothetical protein